MTGLLLAFALFLGWLWYEHRRKKNRVPSLSEWRRGMKELDLGTK